MAKIVVIEDHPASREFLVELLRSRSYTVIEAADGREGLAAARSERPDLILTDILMPTMDGFELARRVADDPDLAGTPIIFFTASYQSVEAARLAASCNVAHFLTKPSTAKVILAAVEEALAQRTTGMPRSPSADFDREHLALVTDKLAQNVGQLEAATRRLDALVKLGMELSSAKTPHDLFATLCREARDLIGCRYAFAGILEKDEDDRIRVAVAAGLEVGIDPEAAPIAALAGIVGRLFRERRALRLELKELRAQSIGFPQSVLAERSLLAAPICSPSKVYGWLCLTDRLALEAFTPIDEEIALSLGATTGIVYENLLRLASIERAAERLSLLHEIDRAILSAHSPEQIAEVCAPRVRQLLSCERVSILTFDESAERALFLAASPPSGPLFPNPPSFRMTRLGEVGPLFEDLRRGIVHLHDLEQSAPPGAARDALLAIGMRYHWFVPMLSQGSLVGALSLRVRDPQAFKAADHEVALEVASQIAIAVQNATQLRRIAAAEARYHALHDGVPVGVFLTTPTGRILEANPALVEMLGYPDAESLKEVSIGAIYADADQRVHLLEALDRDGVVRNFEVLLRRKDGGILWCANSARAVRDASGRVVHYEGVSQDISERKRATAALEERARALREALRRAEESDRLKTAFLGNMSHEIRTPLNVIVGFLDILRGDLGADEDESRRPIFEAIERASRRMVSTVHGILEIARLESNTVEFRAVPVLLSRLIEEQTRRFERAIGEKGLALRLDVRQPTATVRFDPFCLERSLEQLLDNAVKFTAKGTITVRLLRDPQGDLRLEVEDSGIGIDPQYLPQVFEIFSQQDVGHTRLFEGLGLGLAVAKRFLALGGATISVESTPNVGTKFSIHFDPASVVPSEAHAPEPAARRSVAAPVGGRLTVLVVEDDPASRLMLQKMLQGKYRLLFAGNAREARAAFAAHGPDIHVALMDVSLGGGEDGLSLTRHIRETPELCRMRVIATTAHALAEDRAACLTAGADAYLAKPFHRGELIPLLEGNSKARVGTS